MPRKDETTAAFGIYPKQRAKASSPETIKGVDDLVKLLGDIVLPKDAVDVGLMALPVAGNIRKLGAALIAGGATTDAEAGNLSALMRLLSKEAPAQARQIREALGRAYTANVEHSVVGSADKGPVGSIVSGTYNSVFPNQLDIARALKSNGSIADFHTHPANASAAFDISPSLDDFKFASNEYFPGKQNRELRTIIASPADPVSRSPSAYSFFATDDPSKVFNARNLKDATFELQKAGRTGTFKSVLDDPRFREYFDYGGSIGELAENIAPLSLFDLRKAQGMGRGEVVLSGRPLSQNSESTNTELFKIMNPSAVELLTRKGFAKGGAVKTNYADGGAAFGVFPQMKPQRALQDRQAAANAPLSALRGWLAGTAGLPGDIEGLARAGISQLPPQLLTAFPALRAFGIGSRADPTPQMPTTEFYNEYLPGAQLNQTPTGKAFTTAGNLLGGTGATNIAGLGVKGAKATGQALGPTAARMAENYLQRQGLMPGVIKDPGGNFLKGTVEDSVRSMKSQPSTSTLVNVDNIAGTPLFDDYRKFYDAGNENVGLRQWVEENHPDVYKQLVGKQGTALNTFIDKKIVPYIKNEMATPGDPLRAMAEKYAVDKPAKLAEVQGRIDAFAAKMEQTARERGVPVGDLTSMRQQMIGLEKEKALLEAREGLHFTPDEEQYATRSVQNRKAGGTDLFGMGKSPMAQRWENTTDSALGIDNAGSLLNYKGNYPETHLNMVAENPWLAKVPPETKVYSARGTLIDRTGFDHLIDELRNATVAHGKQKELDSWLKLAKTPEEVAAARQAFVPSLPANLHIDPDKLSKLTMPQAVDLVADINAWRATQKIEADLLRANNAATQVVKEYPEQGMKWVELSNSKHSMDKLPEGWSLQEFEGSSPGSKIFGVVDSKGHLHPEAAGKQPATPEIAYENFKKGFGVKELEDALKYEGDTMQHCVGGYCPDVVEGKSRIYSLRDAKGQPRVTIEVEPMALPNKFSDLWDVAMKHVSEESPGWKRLGEYGDPYTALKRHYGSSVENPRAVVEGILEYFPEALDATMADINNMHPKISQIKGFKNKKPADEFLPFVQDFVKSGNWSGVHDLQNSGLRRVTDAFNENELRKIQGAGIEVPTWATPDEIKTIGNSVWPGQYGTPPGGFAQGGLVQHTYNPAKIQQIIASLDDEYDPERIQQIIEQHESAYA